MELTMTNNFGFRELNENEVMTVNAGGIVAATYALGFVLGVPPVVIVGVAVVAIGVVVYNDLRNCYNNGYNEVKYSR